MTITESQKERILTSITNAQARILLVKNSGVEIPMDLLLAINDLLDVVDVFAGLTTENKADENQPASV